MKKILLLSSDINISNKVHLYIDKSKYKITDIDVEVFASYSYIYKTTYDIIIIHDSYLNGYYALVDKLVTTSRWPVIYISNKYNIGQFYNIINDVRFHMINDNKIVNIGDFIDIYDKLITKIDVLEKENKKLLEQKQEEMLVRKAKLKLIKDLELSEDEAYKYIIKLSMDLRVSKGEVAKKIISN